VLDSWLSHQYQKWKALVVAAASLRPDQLFLIVMRMLTQFAASCLEVEELELPYLADARPLKKISLDYQSRTKFRNFILLNHLPSVIDDS